MNSDKNLDGAAPLGAVRRRCRTKEPMNLMAKAGDKCPKKTVTRRQDATRDVHQDAACLYNVFATTQPARAQGPFEIGKEPTDQLVRAALDTPYAKAFLNRFAASVRRDGDHANWPRWWTPLRNSS